MTHAHLASDEERDQRDLAHEDTSQQAV
jgi:hypothetical protein